MLMSPRLPRQRDAMNAGIIVTEREIMRNRDGDNFTALKHSRTIWPALALAVALWLDNNNARANSVPANPTPSIDGISR